MPTIQIFQDPKGPGTCRSCGAAITWAETIRGKKIPLDGRDVVAVRTEGNPIRERVIELIDTGITKVHFETCPEAEKWRRR
jgi:hypothetical protein